MKQRGLIAILAGALMGACFAQDATVTIPVDSPAFVFSPGNWVGDAGRGGELFRQTWNPGAYFRVTWESDSTNTVPTLLLDASMYNGSFSPPKLACNLDGIWIGDLACAQEVVVPGYYIPFGQYKAAEVVATVNAYCTVHPEEKRLSVIDLGPDAARALTPPKGYWGGLHPNPRAHATFAAQIVAQVMMALK